MNSSFKNVPARALENFEPITLSNLLSQDFAEQPWLVDTLIQKDGLGIISAPSASFKTWVSMDIAIAVAMGTPLWGQFETQQCGVLYIDEENGLRRLQKRFRALNAPEDAPIHLSSFLNFKAYPSNIALVLVFAKVNNIKFIVIDSFVRVSGADENSSTDVANTFDYLRAFTKEGIAVLINHHNRKAQKGISDPVLDMRGSSDIIAAVDYHVGLSRDRLTNTLTLVQTKNRDEEEIQPFELQISSSNGVQLEYRGTAKQKGVTLDEIRNTLYEVLEGFGKPSNKGSLVKATKTKLMKAAVRSIEKALESLVEDETFIEKPGLKNSYQYTLPSWEVTTEQ